MGQAANLKNVKTGKHSLTEAEVCCWSQYWLDFKHLKTVADKFLEAQCGWAWEF